MATPTTTTNANELPKDIEVITQDMPMEMKLKIVNFVRAPLEVQSRLASGDLKLEQVARELKLYLQNIDGPMWHVVIVLGQFASYFGYIPNTMFHFKIGRFIVLCWKTPNN